jgi:hypothetical protein
MSGARDGAGSIALRRRRGVLPGNHRLHKTPKVQNRQGRRLPAQPGRQDAGCDTSMSFCGAKTHSPESAWMPFQGSARDRSGNTADPRPFTHPISPPHRSDPPIWDRKAGEETGKIFGILCSSVSKIQQIADMTYRR